MSDTVIDKNLKKCRQKVNAIKPEMPTLYNVSLYSLNTLIELTLKSVKNSFEFFENSEFFGIFLKYFEFFFKYFEKSFEFLGILLNSKRIFFN